MCKSKINIEQTNLFDTEVQTMFYVTEKNEIY